MTEKILEKRNCKNCKKDFPVTSEDQKFYDKFKVPRPKLCPDCRQIRRLMFRNERHLYYRDCDLCGKKVVSWYHPEADMVVYCHDCYWNDKWDGLDYTQEMDFEKSFFEQLDGLNRKAPKMNLLAKNNENAEYVSLSGYNKNCYLLIAAEYNEDCLYSRQIIKSKDCIDVLECFESEQCYQVVDAHKCYELFYSMNCSNCNSGMFLYDCRGCTNCLLSANLRNKEFYIYNEKHSKEDYEKKRKEIFKKLNSGKLEELKQEFYKVYLDAIHKDLEGQNNQDCEGNFLNNCKNCKKCYDLSYAEDCRYFYTGFNIKDGMDISHATDAEVGYELMSFGYGSYNSMFVCGAWSSKNVQYCFEMHSCSDCFGCCGLKYKKYCILNKQYTKEEYEKLVPKIIEKMKTNGEYGEFFPVSMSPFCYNEAFVFEYFPLTKEEALRQGFGWREPDKREYQKPHDDILACKKCGKNYKLNGAELKFYKKHNLPEPEFCFDCRHVERMNMRPPRVLCKRNCDSCGTEITIAYAEGRPEIVYCEKCYLAKVY